MYDELVKRLRTMPIDMRCAKVMREAADAIEELSEPRWIPVTERLPEPHKDVLVSGMEAINNSRVYKVMVNDDGIWRPRNYAPSIIWDYWMPIDPPKEE